VELKALNIIKSFVISSTWNETGLNLGWVFLGGFTQKTRQPAGFFGYLPGFLNRVCWHGGCSRHCRSAQCQVIRPNSWYNWSLSESQYCSTTISLCQVTAMISSVCEVRDNIVGHDHTIRALKLFFCLSVANAYLSANGWLATARVQNLPVILSILFYW